MDKPEAVAILREIFTVCPQIDYAEFVSVDYINVNSQGFFRIRLKVNLDDQSKNAIKPILDSHKVEMTQNKDLIDIYPHTMKK